jgi:hypothetical protein
VRFVGQWFILPVHFHIGTDIMIRARMMAPLMAALLAVGAAGTSIAGPYGDDMAKCLVRSTNPDERNVLVRWIFAMFSLNPAVAPLVTMSAAQRDELDKSTGALFNHLLLESCHNETQLAVRYEGAAAIQYAFQIFGQAAGAELMRDPHVTEAAKGFVKFLDQDKLKALVGPDEPPTADPAKKAGTP